MKIALLGSGKTGSKVIDIVGRQNVTVFNTSNVPTIEKLSGHDVVISFLPGAPFEKLLPILLDANIPLVTGSTGFQWTPEIIELIKQKKTRWIHANNFSLGMTLVHEVLKNISKANRLFDDFSFDINEIHHTKKVDAPSGTALAWEKWIENDANISSERIGDVVGVHELTLNTPFEKIIVKHEALDRKIFAKGAVWAARKLLEKNCDLDYGLHYFEDIAKKELDS